MTDGKDQPPDDVRRLVSSTALSEARAAHPGIAVDDQVFLGHVANRFSPAPRAADLFLACACAARDRQALATFESSYMTAADAALRKRGIAQEIVEEAKQNTRERLLVGNGKPKILDYDGRGPLEQWVRVVIVREAVYLAKKVKKVEPLTFDVLAMPSPDDTPEVSYFKKRYRAEYREALELALLSLSDRERALLRQQFILGLNVDAIGTIYGVHRATAARWVQAAREELWSRARKELAARLRLSSSEIETVVRMIESQLDVSLRRLLASRS